MGPDGLLGGAARRVTRRPRLILKALLAAAIVLAALASRASRVDNDRLRPPPCTVFCDRGGTMLRFVPDANGERHLFLPVASLPPKVWHAFLAAEDERFFSHRGVDVKAVLRALKDNIRHQRIVSGASTLTEQVIRMAYPRERTYLAKLVEALKSARLERRFTKAEILALYLNRVPMGNNLIGVEAASRFYFGKPSARLAWGEAAVLAALPKAPGRLNPYRGGRERLMARKDWVLQRMHAIGFLTAEERDEARAEPVVFLPLEFPMEAPHVVDALLARGAAGDVKTTITLDLQHMAERVLLSHRTRLAYRGASQASAVILENRTGEVAALAGSFAYGPVDGGYNNGATALRSPGSTLKPFLYALALDKGYTAATVLEDTERRYRTPDGEFEPANFDRRRYGPVSMRAALGSSLNLSAVRMLNQVGTRTFYRTLDRLGLINFPDKDPDYYGLGLVVGNPEVTLVQLCAAYACLANGGRFRPARVVAGGPEAPLTTVFSPQACFIVNDILSDPTARLLTFGGAAAMDFPYRVALKTGTSTAYRDGWMVAYTPRYTVGAWVGNFSGEPTWSVSGASGAAPIVSDMVRALYRLGAPAPFAPPEGIESVAICSVSGMLPGPGCPQVRNEVFMAGTAPEKVCTAHPEGGDLHFLGAHYAGWLHDRYRQQAEGRYRLEGFSPDLSAVFAQRREARRGAHANGRGSGDARAHAEPARSFGRQGQHPNNVKIVYPLDGDRYLMPRRGEPGFITLKARVDRPVRALVWFVDGMEHAVTGPPFEAVWELSRGRHAIMVATPDGRGDQIGVVVE